MQVFLLGWRIKQKIKKTLPDPEIADEFVAWLATEISLIEPSHFNVSVDEVLSELLFSETDEILFVDDWRSCDHCDARERSTSLSCRNLQKKKQNNLI